MSVTDKRQWEYLDRRVRVPVADPIASDRRPRWADQRWDFPSTAFNIPIPPWQSCGKRHPDMEFNRPAIVSRPSPARCRHQESPLQGESTSPHRLSQNGQPTDSTSQSTPWLWRGAVENERGPDGSTVRGKKCITIAPRSGYSSARMAADGQGIPTAQPEKGLWMPSRETPAGAYLRF
jgi:hypothetical protein